MSVVRRILNPRRYLPLAKSMFFLSGRGWVHFYAWMLNMQERNNSLDRIRGYRPDLEGYARGFYDLTRGQYHLDFMRRHGLEASHKFVDYGCGFGRTAVATIPFLEHGCYTGVEISAQRIRMAKQWLEEEGLSDHGANFIVSYDLDMEYLPSGTVDFFWLQAVVSHMPLDNIKRVMNAAHRVLKSNGVVLFDYVVSDEGFKQHTIKDFFYTADTIELCVRDSGFRFEVLSDWDDDIEENDRVPNEVMMKLIKV